jgi:hypothetical protein
MIRETFVDKYNEEVRLIICELFNICKQTMKHPGDLLVCQQNGFIGLGAPCLGPGKTGINYMQQLNQIVYPGIGKTTNDNECFVKSRSIFFNGTTDFEQSIEEEMHRYQLIWENGYFLKTLKEISHILNGENYDWELDIDSKTRNTRSNYIKYAIIAKFSKVPNFQKPLNEAYNKDLRNAITHTQYNLIQGGVVLTNLKGDNHLPFYGIAFEQWEEIYSKAWFLLRYIFSGLKDIMELFYVPLTKETISGGIPILIPNGKRKWAEIYAYYFEKGNRWIFHK